MLTKGTKAPDFSLEDINNTLVSLTDYKGKKVVIYFYPKDDTPGCSIQAQTFAELYPEFEKLGVPVIGISKDSVSSHKKFCTKYSLPFTLLADPKRQAITAYDVAVKKMRYGKLVNGTSRSTYLIDENGIIVNVWEDVTPDVNAKEILDFIKNN